MIRTQIQLTERQMRRLRQVAQTQGISVAEVVRRLIDRGIEQDLPDRAALYARAARHIGAFHDSTGALNVSERHDDYLDEAFS